MALVVSTGVRGRHSQVGSLAGETHLHRRGFIEIFATDTKVCTGSRPAHKFLKSLCKKKCIKTRTIAKLFQTQFSFRITHNP